MVAVSACVEPGSSDVGDAAWETRSVFRLSCGSKSGSMPIDAAVADAGSDGGGDAGLDAGVDAGLAELSVELVATTLDGGAEPVVFSEGRAELDSARGFDVFMPVPLKDYRVRLMDWADQVVPSDDVAQASDGGVAYRIDLIQPLHTGRTYTLLIDAQLGPELSDTAGRSFDDVRLTLKVRGEVAPQPGKKPKAPKKPGKR